MSTVTMLKSHEKKNYFADDDVVKCRRNLNFEKKDTASYTGKNHGVWSWIIKEYFIQNITMAMLRKSKAHSFVICRFIKMIINNLMKKRSKKKNWFKLLSLWGFVFK